MDGRESIIFKTFGRQLRIHSTYTACIPNFSSYWFTIPSIDFPTSQPSKWLLGYWLFMWFGYCLSVLIPHFQYNLPYFKLSIGNLPCIMKLWTLKNLTVSDPISLNTHLHLVFDLIHTKDLGRSKIQILFVFGILSWHLRYH